MEKSPGQGQPLALPSGEVCSPLLQEGVQPLLLPKIIRQLHLLQHSPHGLVRCLRAGHGQVFPDGALEEVALMADVGDGFQEALLGNLFQRNPPQGEASGKAGVSAHEEGSKGGLAAAAFSHNGGKAPPGKVQCHILKHLPLRVIGEGQIPAGKGSPFRHLLGARGWGFQIQNVLHLLPGRHAVHGDVEKGA